MRVLMFGGLAILTFCILIGVIIYDRRIKSDKMKLLHSLYELTIKFTHKEAEVQYDTIVGIPMSKLEVITLSDMSPRDFGIATKKLVEQNYIKNNITSLEFTEYGARYYEFVVKKQLNSD
jgi:hypothetical protein